MKFGAVVAVGALLSIAGASTPTKKYIKAPFKKVDDEDELVKRSNEIIAANVKKNSGRFVMEIGVGTPLQNVTVLFSTASSSSDFYIIGADNLFCKSNRGKKPEGDKTRVLSLKYSYPSDASGLAYNARNLNCEKYGVFNSSNSSTFQDTGYFFFGSSDEAVVSSGSYGTDSINIGGMQLDNVTFGINNLTNTTYGELGIGLPDEIYLSNFTSVNNTNYTDPWGRISYPNPNQRQNIISMMKDQGYIKKQAYSMYFNSKKAENGVILFGAVNSLAYEGPLLTIPVARGNDTLINVEGSTYFGYEKRSISNTTSNQTSNAKQNAGFIASMSALTISNNSGSSTNLLNYTVPVRFDSGNYKTYMSGNVFTNLLHYLDSPESTEYGLKMPKCPSKTDNITFTFSGGDLTLKYKDFVKKHKGKCYLDVDVILGAGDVVVLGTDFMKQVYAVYDLEDKEISLGPVTYTKKENITEIDGSVPNAIRAPDYNK
ncbi:hypothetical protein RNJ44_03928 [Nakaseomyces bracarensis]|uniref:Peptidase A1 domain-containing protein n=1 Tax=Nakaseomyces bracarensis TaxID=273131 RepID=A0ABR4NYR4_9SACH